MTYATLADLARLTLALTAAAVCTALAALSL